MTLMPTSDNDQAAYDLQIALLVIAVRAYEVRLRRHRT